MSSVRETDFEGARILDMRDKQQFTYERIATELGLSSRERARQKYIKAKRLLYIPMAKNDKYTKDRDEVAQDEAHPGTPLEPDELEPSPPEFQKETQAQRQEKDVEEKAHPTSELSSLKVGRSPGPAAKGSHPTNELNIRKKR